MRILIGPILSHVLREGENDFVPKLVLASVQADDYFRLVNRRASALSCESLTNLDRIHRGQREMITFRDFYLKSSASAYLQSYDGDFS
jgi:hypothetical protein